jgi:hypothetical protein
MRQRNWQKFGILFVVCLALWGVGLRTYSYNLEANMFARVFSMQFDEAKIVLFELAKKECSFEGWQLARDIRGCDISSLELVYKQGLYLFRVSPMPKYFVAVGTGDVAGDVWVYVNGDVFHCQNVLNHNGEFRPFFKTNNAWAEDSNEFCGKVLRLASETGPNYGG